LFLFYFSPFVRCFGHTRKNIRKKAPPIPRSDTPTDVVGLKKLFENVRNGSSWVKPVEVKKKGNEVACSYPTEYARYYEKVISRDIIASKVEKVKGKNYLVEQTYREEWFEDFSAVIKGKVALKNLGQEKFTEQTNQRLTDFRTLTSLCAVDLFTRRLYCGHLGAPHNTNSRALNITFINQGLAKSGDVKKDVPTVFYGGQNTICLAPYELVKSHHTHAKGILKDLEPQEIFQSLGQIRIPDKGIVAERAISVDVKCVPLTAATFERTCAMFGLKRVEKGRVTVSSTMRLIVALQPLDRENVDNRSRR
jgi:hypothetical protein